VMPLNVSYLSDGVLTVSVMLTNGNGNSTATTLTVTKDTVPPALSVTLPATVNAASAASFAVTAYAEVGSTVRYTVSDGTTSLSGGPRSIPASGKWNVSTSLSSLKDGTLTISFTATDPAGNNNVSTGTVLKPPVAPPAPTLTLNAADDSGISSTDWVTSVRTPRLSAAAASGSYPGTTVALTVNGTAYSGAPLADGSYSVIATATDIAGNATSTSHSLVIDGVAPTGPFPLSGAKLVGATLWTNSLTPILQLSFTDGGSGAARMQLSTDGGVTFGAWQSYATSATITLPNADGVYTIVVRVMDAAGNVGSSSRSVGLKRTAPTITTSQTAPTNAGSYDVGGSLIFTYG